MNGYITFAASALSVGTETIHALFDAEVGRDVFM